MNAKTVKSMNSPITENTAIRKTLNKPDIVSFVRNFGGATSDAILDPNMQIFSTPLINGFIGYLKKGSYAVVFGDPVCSFEAKYPLAKAFDDFAKKNHLYVIYIGASKDFSKQAIKQICSSSVEFGGELTLAPSCNPKKRPGPYGSLIRRKIKQAIRANITVHEHIGNDSQIENNLKNLADLWLKSRKGMQIHISSLYLFSHRIGKRWLYAKQNEEIIGMISLNELKAKKGWLLNHLIVKPNTFRGTSELLITSAIELLESENYPFVSFGIIANKELKQMIGVSPFFRWFLNLVFKSARKVFGLDGLNTFWKKFQPRWEPTYILFSKPVNLRSIINIFFTLKGSLQKEKS